LAHKQIIRQRIATALESIEKIPDLVLRRNALLAILSILTELRDDLELDVVGLTALIEINNNK